MLLKLRDDGVVHVTETVLEHAPRAEPLVEVVYSRPVFQQGWRYQELLTLLGLAQFRRIEAFGGFADEPFDPKESEELVLVAR